MNPPFNDTEGQTESRERASHEIQRLDLAAAIQASNARRARDATVCVVGLGYVGLPLAVGFAQAGYHVVGYDVDEEKIQTLRAGVDTTGELSDELVLDGDIAYTSDPVAISRSEYVIISVPTPIRNDEQPNLEFVESAGRTVGEHLTPGTTVILESTVYPGTTRDVLVPVLEDASGLRCGTEFSIGYSPERATPGDEEHDLGNVVKVVSGGNDAVLEDVAQLYESIVDAGIHRAPSIEVAEASKVVENVQRDLNIALMNELSMAFSRMDIDTHAVLEAAGTKWNFHDYRPGLVGGHCIPVDPYFFVHRAKRDGFVPELVLTGREVNESMPEHVAVITLKALNQCNKTLRESRVLILGLTYKPDVRDIRSSKAADVIEHLQEFEIDVVGHDPIADDDAMRAAFGIEIQESRSFAGFDGVILATPHASFDDFDFGAMAADLDDRPALIDVSGTLDPESVTAAGITYRRP